MLEGVAACLLLSPPPPPPGLPASPLLPGMAASSERGSQKRQRDGAELRVETFFSKSKSTQMRALSNFSAHEVTLPSGTYPTGEHAYHAHKLLHAAAEHDKLEVVGSSPQRARELRGMAESFRVGGSVPPEGRAAKAAGSRRSCDLSSDELRGWEGASLDVQRRICILKMVFPDVRDALLGTGGDYLVHQDNRARQHTPWGGRIPSQRVTRREGGRAFVQDPGAVVGKNQLGILWMELRAACREVDG